MSFTQEIADAAEDEKKEAMIVASEDDEYKMDETEKMIVHRKYSNQFKELVEKGFIKEEYKEMEFEWGKMNNM